ncbi:MAG: alpha/beta-hydrolase N-terminal domain-containing protein [Methyloceanibacter sp.]|nr:alpha/beta-hydrolase N-terminal domain-containing protein [Methyloceanibacter sp.]
MSTGKETNKDSDATPWWLPSLTGVFLGLLFFILTFTPSLVPRPPLFQGLLGGIAFFIGYVIGYGSLTLWRYLELPEVPRAWWRVVNVSLAVACAIAAIIYIPQAAAWQDEVRSRLNMPPTEATNLLQVVLIAVVVAAILMLLSRLVIAGTRAASALVYGWVPRRIAALLGALAFAVLLVTLVNGTLVSAVIGAIDRAQALVDIADPSGASIPTEVTRS